MASYFSQVEKDNLYNTHECSKPQNFIADPHPRHPTCLNHVLPRPYLLQMMMVQWTSNGRPPSLPWTLRKQSSKRAGPGGGHKEGERVSEDLLLLALFLRLLFFLSCVKVASPQREYGMLPSPFRFPVTALITRPVSKMDSWWRAMRRP